MKEYLVTNGTSYLAEIRWTAGGGNAFKLGGVQQAMTWYDPKQAASWALKLRAIKGEWWVVDEA